jgi:hypothetical protein
MQNDRRQFWKDDIAKPTLKNFVRQFAVTIQIILTMINGSQPVPRKFTERPFNNSLPNNEAFTNEDVDSS